ncbi:MAG: hypothetical protein GIX03_15215 [Candidatus Eremiobacteraeota bacterium]|nr:hypothetical protein [Candidatus Eremiobacteraeota bacterium]MBC5804315.1 hypothetical protein [Candidatus Eremiobacteraeota bacterium]MBC5822395.1 hypothetical protein [Candidatus Eremiobacteraeota bacterium]
MKPVPLAAALLVLVFARELAAAAPTEETYTVSGSDNFSIGSGEIRSRISYRGRQTLSTSPHGAGTRLRAYVTYTRDDAGARSAATGEYVTDLSPSGETLATADHDPDNLTVLDQPFAAQLDRQTLHDLGHLHGALPFDFPSPFTRSSLHGYLQHIAGTKVAGRNAVGVRFEAAGPMHGSIPDRPGLTLTGTIAMRGTAFYDSVSAILLALDTTVTVSGNVSNRSRKDPVRIVYSRTIRRAPPR